MKPFWKDYLVFCSLVIIGLIIVLGGMVGQMYFGDFETLFLIFFIVKITGTSLLVIGIAGEIILILISLISAILKFCLFLLLKRALRSILFSFEED